MQLTTTALDFYSVDTIRSLTSQQFEITANLMTFNNAETTFDNTDAPRHSYILQNSILILVFLQVFM